MLSGQQNIFPDAGVPGAAISGPWNVAPVSLVTHPVPLTVLPSAATSKNWVVVMDAVGSTVQVLVALAP